MLYPWQVERLLDSVDAVIYVLDYTKLKTAEEAEILSRLKEINPQLLSRLSQRLFFVVNKADMIETSEGMDAAATQQYVAHLITHQMQIQDFQLQPDQVRGHKVTPTSCHHATWVSSSRLQCRRTAPCSMSSVVARYFTMCCRGHGRFNITQQACRLEVSISRHTLHGRA